MTFNGLFGSWLSQRRKALDLTQMDLANQVSCSVMTIRKIERDIRRPSKQIAERLADVLAISLDERSAFVAFARRSGDAAALTPAQTGSGAALHNLPVQPTPFVGREGELAEIAERLANPNCRLLTLVGPGGIGKTRLALQAAAEKVGHFAQGVYFVSFAAVSSLYLIASAIADALQISFYSSEEPNAQLVTYLREKEILLVLDNFEHLLEGSQLLAQILANGSKVKILATSRERLNMQEEWVFAVEGLPFPEDQSRSALENYSAVQLFLQRARQGQANFSLTENAPAVIRICRLVEGLPLGLELAATWVRLMSCHEIAIQVERNLDMLATPLRNVPERHRTMRAVLEQSWRMLSDAECEVFQKLSVMRSSFTGEAAQGVAGASLAILLALVDKSLVRRTPDGRYHIHELLRQYGAEYLERSGDGDMVRNIHSVYFTDFLGQREADLKGQRQLEALDAIEADFENVRSAWNWAVKRKNYAAVNRSLESLDLFCATRSRWHDRETFFRQAQEELDPGAGREPHPVWGRILGRGERAEPREPEALRAQRERALAIAQQYGDKTEVAYCLWSLGEGVEQAGDYTGALPFLERSLGYFHEVGDRYYIAKVLNELSLCYWGLGKLEDAIKFSQQSLDLRRAICGQREIGWSLYNLGMQSSDAGLYADGVRYLNEARALWGEIDDVFGIAHSSAGLALLAFLSGDFERARTFAQEALDMSTAVIVNRELISVLVLVTLGNIACLEGASLQGRHLCEQSQRLASSLTMPLVEWGLCVAACGLGEHLTATRHLLALQNYNAVVRSPVWLTRCLPVAAIILAAQDNQRAAIELLALAFTHPASATGWMKRWPLLSRLVAELQAGLAPEAFEEAWERGKHGDLEAVAGALSERFRDGRDASAQEFKRQVRTPPHANAE